MTEYPSICAGGIGQFLGGLYESVPVRILGFGPSLSHLLALATSPIGVLLYAFQKIFGHRYVLTNRAVQVWSSRGNRLISSIGLNDFDHIEIQQNPGQVFFQAADLRFVGSGGETLMKLHGVKDAEAFCSTIRRTADARRQVAKALKTIEARG
ncbi:MAG: hypothetical protein R3C49_11920 [Planctomycetaceae bacterium]